MPEVDSPPIVRRGRLRLSVRGLLALIAVVALALGLGQFWLANRDVDRAWVTQRLRSLADPDPSARLLAVEGLALAEVAELPRAVPALIGRATGDPDPSVRASAAGLLGVVVTRTSPRSMPPPAARSSLAGPIAAALIEALRDADPTVRSASASALATFEAPEAVGPLVRRIASDPEVAVRIEAVRALAKVAPLESPVPDALVEAINAPEPSLREAALSAVARPWFGSDRISDALSRRLERADAEDRLELVRVLSMHDPVAASAFVPTLVEGLRQRMGMSWPRNRVVEAIGRIGPAARPALPDLLDAAKESFAEGYFQWEAPCEAIAAIDRDSDEAGAALGLLLEQLEGESISAASIAVRTIRRFGPAVRPVLPQLREIAEDPDRYFAARYAGVGMLVAELEGVDDSQPIAPE